MSGVNKVIVVGFLGADPELKFSENGGEPRCKFSVAVNESWKDKKGQKQERTEWVQVITWGKLAELCGEHLAKGRQVYLEGKLQTSKWQKDGVDNYRTEVVASNVTFLGAKGE